MARTAVPVVQPQHLGQPGRRNRRAVATAVRDCASCPHQPADPSTIRISIWTLTTPPFENMGTLPCRTQRGLRHDTRTLILESHSGRDI